MGFSMKTTDEIVKIVAAGGGLVVEAGRRTTDELIKIATAAKHSGATVVFRNMAVRKTDALMKIAAAGKGKVIFES
jgi:ABC-type branched-subunit amino acid transport system substrate-binding protein